MPYLKVPYSARNKGQYATVREVQESLPPEMKKILSVDMDLDYPCVQFPPHAAINEIETVKNHLIDQGFPAVY